MYKNPSTIPTAPQHCGPHGGILTNAQNVQILGGTFTTSTYHSSQGAEIRTLSEAENQRRLQKVMETLKSYNSSGASHDSAVRSDVPKCHEDTRIAIIRRILGWIRDPARQYPFMWIYGPAGCGKTAIEQTIAEICQKGGILAASFFFSRTALGRPRDKTFFITTIVYQLCVSIPQMRQHIADALDRDPDIFSKVLSTQMDELVIKPMNVIAAERESEGLLPLDPKLIIVDGLDECSGVDAQKEILGLIADSAHRLSSPFLFLIASRPEHTIRTVFAGKYLSAITEGIPLDDDYKADSDISAFLVSRFDEIRRNHPSGGDLPFNWPSAPDLLYLIQKSSGQFIFVSVVMNYIEDHNRHPKRSLENVVKLSSTGLEPPRKTPFAQFDALYMDILSSIDDANMTSALELLSWMTLGLGPSNRSLALADALLLENRGEARMILNALHSLVYIPESNDDDLYFFHASFSDFLLDRSRSAKFFIDIPNAHDILARRWINYYGKYTSNTPRAAEVKDDMGLTSIDVTRTVFLHCGGASLTPELQAALSTLDLRPPLVDIGMDPHRGWWPQLFLILNFAIWLEHQIYTELTKDVYNLLLNNVQTSFQAHWSTYPAQIRKYIPASLTFPLHIAISGTNSSIPTVFGLCQLLSTDCDADPLQVKRLTDGREDSEIPNIMDFEETDNLYAPTKKLLCQIMTNFEVPMINNCFADQTQYTELGFLMAVAFRSRLPNPSEFTTGKPDMIHVATLLSRVLSRAPSNTTLALLLKEGCLQVDFRKLYNYDGFLSGDIMFSFPSVVVGCLLANLMYIKGSGIPFREHSHPSEFNHEHWCCVICETTESEDELSIDPTPEPVVENAPRFPQDNVLVHFAPVLDVLRIQIWLAWLTEMLRRMLILR